MIKYKGVGYGYDIPGFTQFFSRHCNGISIFLGTLENRGIHTNSKISLFLDVCQLLYSYDHRFIRILFVANGTMAADGRSITRIYFWPISGHSKNNGSLKTDKKRMTCNTDTSIAKYHANF